MPRHLVVESFVVFVYCCVDIDNAPRIQFVPKSLGANVLSPSSPSSPRSSFTLNLNIPMHPIVIGHDGLASSLRNERNCTACLAPGTIFKHVMVGCLSATRFGVSRGVDMYSAYPDG